MLLLISVGVGCAFLKGKFTSSLISTISHRFAGSRSGSPPASVSTLLAQLVTGPHVMQPWSRTQLQMNPCSASPTDSASQLELATVTLQEVKGTLNYRLPLTFFWFKLRISSRKVPPARTLLKHMLNFHWGLVLINGDEALAYGTVCA